MPKSEVTDVFSKCEDMARTLGPIMESIQLAREEQTKVANTMKDSEARLQGIIDEEIGRKMKEFDMKPVSTMPKSEVTDVFSKCEDMARTLGPIMESVKLAREEQTKVANTMKDSEARL